MKRQDVTVAWTVKEDEVENEEAWLARLNGAETQAGSETASTTRVAQRREQLMALLVVALVLLLGAGWFWQRQPVATRTGRELQTVLNQEPQAQKANPKPIGHVAATPSGGVNPSKDSAGHSAEIVTEAIESGVKLENYRQVGDHVMAQVTANYPVEGAMQAYRETRFYQRSQDSWKRIGPDPLLLGADKTLQIAHFVILYKEVDADAVYATAPKLEQLYAKLERVLGVAVADSTSNYTVEVVTREIPYSYNLSSGSHKLKVPSPTLLSVPAQMTAATVLYQSMVYPLAGRVVMEALHVDPFQQQQHSVVWWMPIEDALTLWLWWDDGGPLAIGREEVVRWVYKNSQSEEGKLYTPLPARYALLCRTYRIWAITPWDVSIPLGCIDEDKQPPLTHSYADMLFLTRQRMTTTNGNEIYVGPFTRTVLTETVIEYIAATYGLERLRLFVASTGEYASWDTMIPAVFGVSPREFEASWRRFVTEHY